MHDRTGGLWRASRVLALAIGCGTSLGASRALAQHPAPIAATAPSVDVGNAADATPPVALFATLGDTVGPARTDTLPRRRRHAVEYSDWYARRLMIHRIGSYLVLPLFAGEYLLGNELMSTTSTPAGWVKPAHATVAASIGGVFAVNTVTGLWNLWDSRSDPSGRTRRILHTTLMLAADAGFAYTAAIAEDDGEGGRGGSDQTRHRNAALVSIGISTVGTAMMWLWKD